MDFTKFTKANECSYSELPPRQKRLKLLIVIAHEGERETAAEALGEAGFELLIASQFNQGISHFMRRNPDLVLIGANLDNHGSLGLLRRIRAASPLPVLIHQPCEQRLAAYREGADDVIDANICTQELVLRVLAALRRHRLPLTRSAKNLALANNEGLAVESLAAQWQDQAVTLTETESQLLKVLLEFRGDQLSKPYLQLLVLKRPFVNHDRSIDMHISNLRRKLKSIGHPAERIKAVRGYGYCYS